MKARHGRMADILALHKVGRQRRHRKQRSAGSATQCINNIIIVVMIF